MLFNFFKRISLRVLSVSGLIFVPVLAFAQTCAGATPCTGTDCPALTNPLCASSLTALIQEILGYVVEIGSLFLVLMLIYVGFLFVSARGNDEKLKGARSALLWTVIGGLLLLGAQAIAVAIAATASAL